MTEHQAAVRRLMSEHNVSESAAHAMLQTALERQQQEVQIQQKINQHHRDAFRSKFPGQTEHCLRLIMERLQMSLDKRSGVDPTDPKTWRLSSQEIESLTASALNLTRILDRNVR